MTIKSFMSEFFLANVVFQYVRGFYTFDDLVVNVL